MSWLKDYKSSFNFHIMDYLKTFNVITLSFLLILTGCFGMFGDEEGESAEAEDSTTTSALTAQDIADAMILATNSPPKLSVKKFLTSTQDYEDAQMLHNNWEPNGFFNCPTAEEFVDDEGNDIGNTLEEQRAALANSLGESEYVDYIHLANLIEVGDCVIYFDFVSVDPDGDSMTKGIDTNFDGVIDIPITPNDGYTLVGIDNSTSKQVFNGIIPVSCTQIDLAFIAIDEHGASTVEFMHFIGMESCEGDGINDGPQDVPLNPYSFSGADGAGADEVVVTMDQGGDLGWASAGILVSIGGGPSVTAADCAVDSTAPCYTVTETDTAWNVGEAITITTQGCGQDAELNDISSCDVDVVIRNDLEGVILYMITIYME